MQSLEGQVRVLKDALEARIGCELTGPREGEPILSWLVEFASVLLNRYEVSKDGKTAYERLRGRNRNFLVSNFGRFYNGGELSKELAVTHWTQSGRMVALRVTEV